MYTLKNQEMEHMKKKVLDAINLTKGQWAIVWLEFFIIFSQNYAENSRNFTYCFFDAVLWAIVVLIGIKACNDIFRLIKKRCSEKSNNCFISCTGYSLDVTNEIKMLFANKQEYRLNKLKKKGTNNVLLVALFDDKGEFCGAKIIHPFSLTKKNDGKSTSFEMKKPTRGEVEKEFQTLYITLFGGESKNVIQEETIARAKTFI